MVEGATKDSSKQSKTLVAEAAIAVLLDELYPHRLSGQAYPDVL